MPAGALLLALAAAAVHAGWNLLLARAKDPQAAGAVALIVAVVVWAPVALLTWRVESEALPWIAASAALEAVYFALLSAAYAAGELSLVYPLARGGAPVLLVIAGVAGVGGKVGAAQVAGVGAIAAGILLVRGAKAEGGRAALLAAGVAVTLAAYTLVDREGVRHAAPIAYLWLVLLPAAPLQLALAMRLRGREAILAARGPSVVAAGAMTFGAYALVLAALRLAPAAPVAAVRETSVVMAVALGALVLGEEVGRRRLAGAALVAAGTALVAA